MSISTKAVNKKERLEAIREFHRETLFSFGIDNFFILPKMAYKPYGMNELHISFFPSEIERGEDIYVEFTNRDFVPEDEKRTLYKWKFNPHYQEEYATTDPHPQTGHIRYLIPVDELVIIKSYIIEEKDEEEDETFEDLPNPELDLPIDQITIKDLAALLLKAPVSEKEWLNNIIKTVNK